MRYAAGMPQTLLAPAHHELVIKKSRFIACVQPMADRAEALVARLNEAGNGRIAWAREPDPAD